MKDIKITLSKDQQKKFEVIQWLTDPMGPRGSGRSYLLALSFVMHSLKYRTWVTIFDHDNRLLSKRDLLHQIESIVYGIKGVRLKIKGEPINHPRTEIMIEPIENYVYRDNIKYES